MLHCNKFPNTPLRIIKRYRKHISICTSIFIDQTISFSIPSEELVLAAFRGEEELAADEIWRVARYNGIPLSVLTCPKVIMLDMSRRRHRKMVAEVDNLFIRLKCMAREGNQKAEKYVEWADRENQKFLKAAHINKLSYIHYLGAKRQLSDYILFARPEPTKRGISARKGGVA